MRRTGVHRTAGIAIAALALVAGGPTARAGTDEVIASGVASAALASIVCLTGVLASEDEEPEEGFARRGPFVGAHGRYATLVFDDFSEAEYQFLNDPAVSLSYDDSFGASGLVGYRCAPRFSAEVQAEWISGFEGDFSFPGLGQFDDLRLDPIVATANLKAYLLTGRIQPYLLVGAGAITIEVDPPRPPLSQTFLQNKRENEFAMRFGGGVDVYATDHIVVTVGADYVRPFGSFADLDYVSIGWGFQYRF